MPETLDNNGLTIIVTYEAKMDDSGKRLSCEVTQIDDEGNKVISTVSTLLKIQEKIPNEKKGLSIALISGMYGVRNLEKTIHFSLKKVVNIVVLKMKPISNERG